MRLLIVSSRFPYPLEKGDKLRLYHQIRYLSSQHDIYLAAICSKKPPAEYLRHMDQFCKKVYCFRLPPWRRIYNLSKAVFTPLPFQVALFYDPLIRKKIRRVLLQEDIEHIYCQLVRTAEYVRTFPLPKTIDFMDTFSAGMKRRAAGKSWPRKWLYNVEHRRLKNYEAGIIRYFDHHTIISDRDREDLPFSNKSLIKVIPNGVDIEYFRPDSTYNKKYDLVFVGNMGYEPNIDAAVRLVKWTRDYRFRDRPLEILIAGARPGRKVINLAGEYVDVAGWMPDIREAYAGGKIFAAPLLAGSGLQNKILESMSMGLPAITTTHVNESIGAKTGKEILIADTREEFLDKLDDLLLDPGKRKELADNALAFVRNHYSWERFNDELDKLIRKPLPKHGFSSFSLIET